MADEAAGADTFLETETRPQRKGLGKGIYVLPSVFTAANIAMGFYAVLSALRGFQLLHPASPASDLLAATEHFDHAALAIGVAFLFDAVDGRIARMTKTTTEIGVQLDSLADVLTFGIAPLVLIYAWGYGAAFDGEEPLHRLGLFLSFMFLICGAFRLARFNVQATRPRPLAEGTVKVDKKSFIGLPIPAAAGLIAAIVHFAPTPLVLYRAELATAYSGLLMALVAALSALMVSTIRYSSFKTVGTGKRSARVGMLLIAAGGMLVWLYSRYVLLALVAGYVLSGVAARLITLLRRRPSHAA